MAEPQITPAPRARRAPPPPAEYRWPKGISGNPGGRPRGVVSPRKALEVLSSWEMGDVVLVAEGKRPERWPEDRPIPAMLVAAARALLDPGAKAYGLIADRIDGKPAQALEVSGPDGGPVSVAYRVIRVEDEAP